MQQRILIVGAGFAGMWSALSAARLLDQHGVSGERIEVALVAPRPMLTIRPRLYETRPASMEAPLRELFAATGVQYVQGRVDAIHTGRNEIEVVDGAGGRFALAYDRLVLAAGSRLFRPDVPGLVEHAFSIDQIDEAAAFEAHCRRLAQLPETPARNTVIVAGGGFTGIEIAAELPERLRGVLGGSARIRVVVVERADEIGPDLGPGPRPVIQQALSALGVECRLGTAVTSIDAGGVTTSQGERIAAHTVVWTAGLRAHNLTEQIPGSRDSLGRLHVDGSLRVPGVQDVFAAGDTAYAATDDAGNHALMSCQHALTLGRFAGNNAAADLLGIPSLPYRQPRYVTCLDLGPWGAVFTEGWDRKVQFAGADAKARKRFINGEYIYPPKPIRAEALAAADPQAVG